MYASDLATLKADVSAICVFMQCLFYFYLIHVALDTIANFCFCFYVRGLKGLKCPLKFPQ